MAHFCTAVLTKVGGIKISLLDKDKEIQMRRRLPKGVKMYTVDDFNYPELIDGDDKGYSHALLGIFDPLAPAAAYAVSKLAEGDAKSSFRATLNGIADLRSLRAAVEAAGYKGPCEVEIFSATNWWKRDPAEMLDVMVERFRGCC